MMPEEVDRGMLYVWIAEGNGDAVVSEGWKISHYLVDKYLVEGRYRG